MVLLPGPGGGPEPVFELAAVEWPGAAAGLHVTNLQRSQASAGPHLDHRHQANAAAQQQQLQRALHPHMATAQERAAHGAAPQIRSVVPPPASSRHPATAATGAAAAQRLNSQLRSVEVQQPLRAAVGLAGCGVDSPPRDSDASLARRVSGLVLRVGDMLQPQGEAPGDATWGERTANVLTSLPFLAIGWHMHRRRLTQEGRAHAASLVAVGAAATLYHATSGAARRLARKVDYWTIAWSSSRLTRALFADAPPGVHRASKLSLLAVPFRPFAVSTANALVMQAEFARQAAAHKAVRADLKRHYAAAALGLAAFFAEDLVMYSGWGGYVHSAWHCLACYGVYTMDGLISHKERQHLQRQLAAQGPGAAADALGAKPLRRPVHSSASSLPSYGTYGCGGSYGKAGAGGRPGDWSSGTASP